MLDATAGSDAGIDVVSSEYATIAAEQTALEHLADESPTRSSRASRSMRRAAAPPAARQPARDEGEPGADREGAARRPATPASSSSTAPTIRAAARWQGARPRRWARRRSGSTSAAPICEADPARLADEAASISLFGGARWILVEPAGDESVPAVEALLEAPAAGNPVVADRRRAQARSKLLKLALGAPAALAFASYAPDGRDADRLVLDMARAQGLIIRPDVARRIAEAAAATARSSTQELDKFALYARCRARAAAADRP